METKTNILDSNKRVFCDVLCIWDVIGIALSSSQAMLEKALQKAVGHP